MRHVMRRASAVRIDHVMGLHRLFWIPEGAGADRGVYVRYAADELQAVVALEAHRAGTVVVGEDLGTVPPEVRSDMAAAGVLRSWVLEFEVTPDEPLPDPPVSALASVATHDLPRFAAFWDGTDLEDRVREGRSDGLAGQRVDRERWRAALASHPADPGADGDAAGRRRLGPPTPGRRWPPACCTWPPGPPRSS